MTGRTTRWPFRRIAFALAVTAFGAGVPTPLYPVYRSEMHLSAGVLALVFGAYSVGVLATMFFVAPLSDRVGRRPILYVGLVLTGVSGILFLVASGAAGLALARFVSGLAVGATTSTATAAMASLEPRNDQHHVARVAVAANFGGVGIGILLSGTLVEYLWAPTQLIYLVLALASMGGIVAIALTPETVPHPVAASELKRPRIEVPRTIRGPFWISVGALSACYAIYGLFAALAPSYLRTDLGVANHALSGAVVALMFGAAAIAQLALGQVRDRDALLVGFPLLVVALALFVVALPLNSLALLTVAAGLLGVAIGFAFMGAVTLIDRVCPSEMRGGVLSGFYLSGYLALSIPTLGVAVAADAIGLPAAGVAFGMVLGTTTAVLAWITWRTPTPPGGEGRPRGA
ncbi:MAG: MFS transporter [Thermoplasmata archaeon]